MLEAIYSYTGQSDVPDIIMSRRSKFLAGLQSSQNVVVKHLVNYRDSVNKVSLRYQRPILYSAVGFAYTSGCAETVLRLPPCAMVKGFKTKVVITTVRVIKIRVCLGHLLN